MQMSLAAADPLHSRAGVSSLGLPGVPWHVQILADQLTLSQPKGRGADYALNITTRPQDFQTFRSPCQVVRMLFTRVVINNKTNLVSLVQIESEEK